MTAYISPFTADLIGFAGMFCIVGAFAYSNLTKVMNMILFNGVNLLGAVLLTFSLLINFNLPSLMLEVIWMAIAIFGLGKEFLKRRSARA